MLCDETTPIPRIVCTVAYVHGSAVFPGGRDAAGPPVPARSRDATAARSGTHPDAARMGGIFKASVLKPEFAQGGSPQYLALRYTQALNTQMARTAVCNRHHSVDLQFCRRLLLSLYRLPGDELSMTQELIANMPGVRREA